MTQRSSADIATDIATARAARMALVAGERVDEVWRDGRRMIFAEITLKEIDTVIASLEQEYAAAVSVEAGGPRRRPISLAYRN